jgi:vitamin B12/bleomycin/antimicrobial peptide transport system ATP-binding/permease protein
MLVSSQVFPHNMGRVLLSKPRLVLMDESTSALDTGNEAALYAALGAQGITYVSVGHRPSLVLHPLC